MSSYEYNQLLKFLYFEGFADSYEEAEYILEEMTDEEFEDLIEAKDIPQEVALKLADMLKGAPTISRRGSVARGLRQYAVERNKKRLSKLQQNEEFEEVLEAYKEPDLEKMKRQEYRHTKKATSQSRGSRGNAKNRAFKMAAIRGSLKRGEDPRADTFGGVRASNPEDHRAAYTKNPMNNPPRRVKEPGVQREEAEMQEAWYSGKGTYRTTTSGRKVRWDEDEATDNAVSDMMQKRRAKKAAQERMRAKGTVPKKDGKDMFESVVEYLFVEGYADTIESAELMAGNISENWMVEILNNINE